MGAISALNQSNSAYPSLLKQIHDPPDPLYVRGTLSLDNRLIISVVGSRKATAYGQLAVNKIVKPLADAGAVIVSGMAFGIDAAAHRAALEVGGTTVAVLGSAIDRLTPRSNVSLGERILDHGGAVVSQYAPGEATFAWSFAARNRIIAGMSHASIIIEAALDSGSLITATCALEENRDVFVVPGPISSLTSEGTNNLLKIGARPVTEPNDVLATLRQPLLKTVTKRVSFNPTEQKIVDHLSDVEPVHVDKLVELATIDLLTLQNQLTLLELRGYVKMISPGYYVKLGI